MREAQAAQDSGCQEKIRLLREYSDAADTLCHSLGSLLVRGPKLGPESYRAIHRVTELNRIAMERARAQFERHLTDHQC